MAADPIAAAEQLAGSTYSSAQERSAAGKKALLDNLGAQGTYTNALVQKDAAQAAPQPAVTQPGDNAYPQLAALSVAGYQQQAMANQAAVAAAAHLAATQQASQAQQAGTYFDQVGAAIPIEQSRAASDAAQVLADLQAKREAQVAARQMAELNLQTQREQLAGAKEARAAAAAKQGNVNALDPAERYALQSQMEMDALSAASGTAQDKDGFYSGKFALPDGTLSLRGKALEWLTENPGHSAADAAQVFGIKQAQNIQQVADAYQTYQTHLQNSQYYTYFGGAPTPQAPAPVLDRIQYAHDPRVTS